MLGVVLVSMENTNSSHSVYVGLYGLYGLYSLYVGMNNVMNNGINNNEINGNYQYPTLIPTPNHHSSITNTQMVGCLVLVCYGDGKMG